MGGSGEIGRDVQSAVGAAGRAARRCGEHVDGAAALLEDRVGEVAVRLAGGAGGCHQLALHLVGSQSRLRLEEEGHRARGHGRGHRRAGQREQRATVVVGPEDPVGERGIDVGKVVRHRRQDVAARRHDLGFDEAFEGRAVRRERCQPVVGRVVRRVVIGHGADRDDVGHVARYVDRLRARAAVAGGHDDDDTGLPRAHDRLGEGVVPVIGLRGGTERQVGDTDAVGVLVGDNPVESQDHLRVAAAAVGVERAQGNDICARRNAVVLAGCVARRGGGDRGDVGAVSVAVDGIALIRQRAHVRQVDRGNPAVAPVVVGERRTCRCDPQAGVDHGDGHALAGDAGGVQGVGTDLGGRRRRRKQRVERHRCRVGRDRGVVADPEVVIGRHAHAAPAGQGCCLGLGQRRDHAVDDADRAHDPATGGSHLGGGGGTAAGPDNVGAAGRGTRGGNGHVTGRGTGEGEQGGRRKAQDVRRPHGHSWGLASVPRTVLQSAASKAQAAAGAPRGGSWPRPRKAWRGAHNGPLNALRKKAG